MLTTNITTMKTGLILLQSIASSAVRSGRQQPHGHQRHYWSRRSRGRIAQHTPTARAGVRAAFLAAGAATVVGLVGVGGGATTTYGTTSTTKAMCSGGGGDDHGRDVDGTVVVTSSSSSTIISTPAHEKSGAVSAPPSVAMNGKLTTSIDEPDRTPEHNPLLPFPESSLRHDTYNGVTLDLTLPAALPTTTTTDADAFRENLGRALEIWSDEGRRGIWIKIPTSLSHLVPAATVHHGFDFQHAEGGYCVLTRWLPQGSTSRLPHGPTHQVGVGALVVHPLTGRMLAVQEKSGPAAKRRLWKMPTGLADPGEDIHVAAVRELKEETGLDCVFDRIICFRQAHGGMFNRSDMFFVCLCKLDPKYEEMLKRGGEVELLPQEEEILMADWIDMEDYARQSLWRESPLYKEMNGAMLKAAGKGIAYASADDECNNSDGKDDDESHGFVAKNLPIGHRPGKNTIYVSSKL